MYQQCLFYFIDIREAVQLDQEASRQNDGQQFQTFMKISDFENRKLYKDDVDNMIIMCFMLFFKGINVEFCF